MAKTLIQLSDIHLFATKKNVEPSSWGNVMNAIQTAINQMQSGTTLGGVVITGDLIDSPDIGSQKITNGVRAALSKLRAAVGDGVPIVILPGNHDRRTSGVLQPWTEDGMAAVDATGLPDITVVAPRKGHSHASRLEQLGKNMGCTVAAYDSTHAYEGIVSAGGHLRTDDLLSLGGMSEDTPTVLLMHHHIIPTPITDVSAIRFDKAGLFARTVGEMGRRLIAFGDREEVFMTALGAGSFLSSVHALGSATLVLHGHKHLPVARMSAAMHSTDGDVLMVSAGSAGVSEAFAAAGASPELWPSFNIVTVNDPKLEVEVVSVSPTVAGLVSRRQLVSATREGRRWSLDEIADTPAHATVHQDTASFDVIQSAGPRWTFSCQRWVETDQYDGWREPVSMPRGATLVGPAANTDNTTFQVTPGAVTQYSVNNGLCASLAALHEEYGMDESPFEWLGLTVRHPTANAVLSVKGLTGLHQSAAFGSRTDLRTGERRPLTCSVDPNGTVSVSIKDCPPLQFLQILWPLA